MLFFLVQTFLVNKPSKQNFCLTICDALLLFFVLSGTVFGATLTVKNLNDSGADSLRDAISQANATAGADTIDFTVAGTITLTSGNLTITDDLTITGPGANSLTVDGNNADRVFVINSGVVTFISGLTIANGFGVGYGGGIYNTGGTVNITDCTISDNLSDTQGGGIYNAVAGTLNIKNSTIFGNKTDPFEGEPGGGIASTGTLNINNSTIANNSTPFASGGGIAIGVGTVTISNSTISGNSSVSNGGGGIYNSSATVTVTNTTISGNSAFAGAGIDNTGTLTIVSSTISGNTAATDIGGISNGGTVTITNSTISGNSSPNGVGAIFNNGTASIANSTISNNTASGVGGIAVANKSGGTFNMSGTIVAVQAAGNDCAGAINDLGYNLESGTSCGFTSVTSQQNVTAAQLNLGSLANNGGPTQTHALLAGSVAIDAGSANCGVNTDQRGLPRPVKGHCDIGAFELVDYFFADDFNDMDFLILPFGSWTMMPSNSYSATTGDAVATTVKKADLFSPNFGGCTDCTVAAHMSVNTAKGKVLMLGWFTDARNSVKVSLSQKTNTLAILQRAVIGGITVHAKKKISFNVNVNQVYDVWVNYNSATNEFIVTVDGVPQPGLTLKAVATPAGNTIKFRVRSDTGLLTTGTIGDVVVF
ncbi:MAG: hypothetical protein C5B54_10955 [Acidobacteria bacterium]|nr:MAG: hypothetical protein C5B54_10955 [Acidobacteriota bacterium]